MKIMNKSFIIISMIVALAGCADISISEGEKPVDMSFRVGTEHTDGTKTFLATGNAVLFAPGDSIAVFPEGSTSAACFRVGNHWDAQSVANDVIYGRISQADRYYAFYPWTNSVAINTGAREIYASLPAEQYKPSMSKTFDPKAALSVGVSDANNYFYMMNVGSLVKVSFTDRIFVDKIVLTSLPGLSPVGNPLAGDIAVSIPEGETAPYWRSTGSTSPSVTLYVGEDGITVGDKCCFVVLPGIYGGLKLEVFVNGEPKYTLIHNKLISLDRSRSYSFPPIDPNYSVIDFVELEELKDEYYEW